MAKVLLPKALLIVTFFCLFPFNGALGRTPERGASTEARDKGLDKEQLQTLLKPYLQLKSLRAQFVQKKHLSEISLDLISTGTLKVEKSAPNASTPPSTQVLWTVLTPSFLEVAIGEKDLTLTSMKEGVKQTQKISFEQMGKNQGAQGLAMLLPWLEMDVEGLLKEYTVEKINSSEIKFTPKNSSLFKSIQLRLGKDQHIKNLLFHEKTGDSIDITFKATKIENFK